MTARDVAFQTIRDVAGDAKRGAQAAFDYRCGKTQLDERDRAFAAELAYGSIKARRLLDWYLRPYVGERLIGLPPSILEILRMGVYQMRLMGGVEVHAAVHETVNLAMRYGHRGTAGLVNAVLRRFDREAPSPPQAVDFADRLDYLATLHSLPTWIVKSYATRFSDDHLEAVLAGVNGRPQHAVTVDRRRLERDAALAEFAARGVTAHPSTYVAESCILEGTGMRLTPPDDARFFAQSESAAMAVDLLAPQAGEAILELCAGRGNKTLQLAMRQGSLLRLEAVEIDERKAAQLRDRLVLAQISAVDVRVSDARFATGDAVDAIVVDAPCSAIGTIGRHPEARWRKDASDAARLAPVQIELLHAAIARLRPGGRVVYGVCSTDRREGEEVVEHVLRETGALRFADLPERYAPLGIAPGMALVPPGIAGRDGFFLASLVRS